MRGSLLTGPAVTSLVDLYQLHARHSPLEVHGPLPKADAYFVDKTLQFGNAAFGYGDLYPLRRFNLTFPATAGHIIPPGDAKGVKLPNRYCRVGKDPRDYLRLDLPAQQLTRFWVVDQDKLKFARAE
jgi:hypothetical protein